MAKPKSASFTAAFLHLLARSRFSGYRVSEERHNITKTAQEKDKNTYETIERSVLGRQITCRQTLVQDMHTQKHTTHTDITPLSAVLFCRSLQRFGEGCTLHLCGPDKTLSLIIHCQKIVLIMGLAPAPSHSVPEHLYLTTASIMALRMALGNISSDHLIFFPPVIDPHAALNP